jgi:hypothetical protein
MGEYIRALGGRKRSGASGRHDLCRGHGLTDVALGVVGDVNKKATHRCGQRFLANEPGLFHVRDPESAHAFGAPR